MRESNASKQESGTLHELEDNYFKGITYQECYDTLLAKNLYPHVKELLNTLSYDALITICDTRPEPIVKTYIKEIISNR